VMKIANVNRRNLWEERWSRVHGARGTARVTLGVVSRHVRSGNSGKDEESCLYIATDGITSLLAVDKERVESMYT